MEKMRLQVYMAKCGVSSRRKAEEIILAGRVEVNGEIVTEMGYKVSKDDLIFVDGKRIKFEEKVYYALNKPSGYVTTSSDEKGRKTVLDLFLEEDRVNRIFSVGRLDYDTEGVLIMTNDGELANLLTNSKNGVEKEYQARITGKLTKEEIKKLVTGLQIDDYVTKPCQLFVDQYDKKSDTSLVRLIITEGKNHQVKKMFSSVGHEVLKLKRLRFATITLEHIGVGYYRMLKPHEVKQLYNIQ